MTLRWTPIIYFIGPDKIDKIECCKAYAKSQEIKLQSKVADGPLELVKLKNRQRDLVSRSRLQTCLAAYRWSRLQGKAAWHCYNRESSDFTYNP